MSNQSSDFETIESITSDELFNTDFKQSADQLREYFTECGIDVENMTNVQRATNKTGKFWLFDSNGKGWCFDGLGV